MILDLCSFNNNNNIFYDEVLGKTKEDKKDFLNLDAKNDLHKHWESFFQLVICKV